MRDEAIGKELTDEEKQQVEIVSITLPDDERKNRMMWYLSLLIVVAIVVYIALQWWIPKYHSTSEIEAVSYLYKEFKLLEEESAIDTKQAQLQYDSAAVRERLLKMDRLVEALSERDERFEALATDWQRYSHLLRSNLPDSEVVNRIPSFEANLESRHNAFIRLVESFAQEIDYKRTFSIETVRKVEQLMIKAYKVKASLNRLLAINLANKVDALATLTDEINEIEIIFGELREGSPTIGVQSLRGTLDEEALNEIEFAFHDIATEIEKVVVNIPRILELRDGLKRVESQREILDQQLQKAIVDDYQKERQLTEKIADSSIILILMIALAIILIGMIYLILSRKITHLSFRERSEREQNEYHERAILKLIDQMEFVANGDLSMELTVTDDSTGIIADSVNVAMGRIRTIIKNAHHLKGLVMAELAKDQSMVGTLREVSYNMADYREITLAHIGKLSERMEEIERRIHLLNMTERDDEEAIREQIRILSELLAANNLSLGQMERETTYSQRREMKLVDSLAALRKSIEMISQLMEQLEGSMSRFAMPEAVSQKSDLKFQVSEIRKQDS